MATEVTTAGIVVLDPTTAPLPVDARLAQRPDTLDGKVLGVLSNNKNNASALLDNVYGLLSERYEFSSVIRRSKPDVSRPCPEETVEDLASQCDLIITAIGD